MFPVIFFVCVSNYEMLRIKSIHVISVCRLMLESQRKHVPN